MIELVRSGRIFTTSFITLSHTNLQLEGSVVFSNITTHSIISLKGSSTVIISGSVKFSYNHVHELINFYENDTKYITMNKNSVINITNTEVWKLFAIKPTIERYPYPYCFFQYFSNSTSDSKVTVENRNFLITFYNNHCKQEPKSNCFDYIPITNCQWLLQSAFSNTIPLEINNDFIQFINNSGTYKLKQIIEQSSLCVCTNELHYDCQINDLGYLYPGQTLTTCLHHKRVSTGNTDTANAVAVKTDINQPYIISSIVLNVSENIQPAVANKTCNKLRYTIGFPTKSYCELFLKMASDSDSYLNVFYIRQIACPLK